MNSATDVIPVPTEASSAQLEDLYFEDSAVKAANGRTLRKFFLLMDSPHKGDQMTKERLLRDSDITITKKDSEKTVEWNGSRCSVLVDASLEKAWNTTFTNIKLFGQSLGIAGFSVAAQKFHRIVGLVIHDHANASVRMNDFLPVLARTCHAFCADLLVALSNAARKKFSIDTKVIDGLDDAAFRLFGKDLEGTEWRMEDCNHLLHEYVKAMKARATQPIRTPMLSEGEIIVE